MTVLKPTDEKPTHERSREGFYMVRLRAGKNPETGKSRQVRVTIHTTDARVFEERFAKLRDLARQLTPKGPTDEAEFLLKRAGECESDEAFAHALAFAAKLAPAPLVRKPRRWQTFEALGKAWTSGELAKYYPDEVPTKKSANDDQWRLGYLYEIAIEGEGKSAGRLGAVPLVAFDKEHYRHAMRNLPETAQRPATRRHYAQAIKRVMRLARQLDLIDENPIADIPLPEVMKGEIVFPFLYPDEDRALLVHPDPQTLLLRAFFGVLTREGMRIAELLGLLWTGIDAARGVINIGPRKNGRTGVWHAQPGVCETLALLRPLVGGDGPFMSLPRDEKYAERLRDLLLAAGVDRRELFTNEPGRRRLRGHDLRGTFVTLAFAAGKPEGWITQRTGHMTSDQVNGYRRSAKHAEEIGMSLGDLARLDEALGLVDRPLLPPGPPAPRRLPAPVVAHGGEGKPVPSEGASGGISGARAPETAFETEGALLGGEAETESVTVGKRPAVFGSFEHPLSPVIIASTEARSRTGKGLPPADFESGARPPEGSQITDFRGVSDPRNVSKGHSVSADDQIVRQKRAPGRALIEALEAAAQAAIVARDWAAVTDLGKMIEDAERAAAKVTELAIVRSKREGKP